MFDRVILDTTPKPLPEGLCVINAEYVAKQPHKLKCVEGKARKEAWKIAEAATGQLWFKAKHDLVTMHNEREVEDHAGRPAFTLRTQVMAFKKTVKVYWPGTKDKEIFTSYKKMSMRSKKVTVVSEVKDINSHKHLTVSLLGDARGSAAVIVVGKDEHGHVIARITNAHDVSSNLSGMQDYNMEVAAGADVAMCAALCMIYDECVTFKADAKSDASSSSGEL